METSTNAYCKGIECLAWSYIIEWKPVKFQHIGEIAKIKIIMFILAISSRYRRPGPEEAFTLVRGYYSLSNQLSQVLSTLRC